MGSAKERTMAYLKEGDALSYKTQRTIEGVRYALEHGTKSGRPFGRPAAELPDVFARFYQQWKEGVIQGVDFAKLLNISRPTLYRWIKQYESQGN